MPGVDFRSVRSIITIEQVLELIQYEGFTRSNAQLRGPCPLHDSTSPRSRCFSVNLKKNTYHCFKCGAEGNHLDLWAAFTKTSIFAAAVDLCERLQLEIPYVDRW